MFPLKETWNPNLCTPRVSDTQMRPSSVPALTEVRSRALPSPGRMQVLPSPLTHTPNIFLSQTPPMPHHPAHCQATLRRAGTLVHSLPRKQSLFTTTAAYKPLLPFLWPRLLLTRRHSTTQSLTRTYSTTQPRRARDEHRFDMGKEGKGNFQLKTPKGTRDCETALGSLVRVHKG